MIIGLGDIASVLNNREDRIYFASGVSNSQETRESEYDREKMLLLCQDRSKHFVYFSSLSIFYLSTRYTRHKREMEELVRLNFLHHTIMRMGNISWGINPHTLINFLRNKIRNGEPYDVQNVYRYIVDVDEFLHWIDLIPPWSCEMNVVGRRMKVKDVVREYCCPTYFKGEPWLYCQS